MPIRDNLGLGHAIRQFRLKARLTQTDLGNKARIRQRTVSDIERGKGAQTETLFAIFTALELEMTIEPRQSIPFVPGNY